MLSEKKTRLFVRRIPLKASYQCTPLALVMLCLFSTQWLLAQRPISANRTANDAVTPYRGVFRAGINLDIYRGFTDEMQGKLAAGKPDEGVEGIGATTLRPALFEDFTENYGYDTRLSTFRTYDSLGLKENTLIVGFPTDAHRDTAFYCPTERSTVFKNLYAPIWDNGENGTPVNDSNYCAAYFYKLAIRYKNKVRFWEIWNEPGFDYTQNRGYLNPGQTGNWWDNNPNPCDYKLRAPIFTYVRMLRIAYEVIKSVDSTAYVCTSGLGYPSFLDAILRNTDNPDSGRVTAAYPLGGGAYFDAIGYHCYPHFDGGLRTWNGAGWDYKRHSDAALMSIGRVKNEYADVLRRYGYGVRFPEKQWLITECNLPRRTFGEFIGSNEAQRNFLIKSFVACAREKILQFHVFKLAEQTTYDQATYEFDVMGLYQKLDFTQQLRQTQNEAGIAYRTASLMLRNLQYDSLRTRAMLLPSNVDGGAFVDSLGNYTYVLWAKTTQDRSENATASYSFPDAFGLNIVRRRFWDDALNHSETLIAPQNISLTATPIYVSELLFQPNSYQTCVGSTLNFSIFNAANLTAEWVFEAGSPSVSSSYNPVVQYLRAGNFSATLKLKNTNGTVVRQQAVQIQVQTTPVANFEVRSNNPTAITQNLSTPNATNFTWQWGDGSPNSTIFQPQHVYYQTGTYTIQLTASNRCGNTASSKSIRITSPDTPRLTQGTADVRLPRFTGRFRAGVNFRYSEGWRDEQVADISAGNLEKNIKGINAKAFRTLLPEYFTRFWGEDIRSDALRHNANLDLRDNVMTVGFPDAIHRDSTNYCASETSALFKNMYANIWDNGENGTPVNDSNYYAAYIWRMVQTYKNQVKFWEIWDSPGVDLTGEKGWKPRGTAGNWWDNAPDPCDMPIHAPIQQFVRLMRISYEVIKSVDTSALVTFSGAGYPSFLDAVLRTTDNPADGSPRPNYPNTGGAYFDAVSYSGYPHIDGSVARYDINTGGFVYQRHSDAAALGVARVRDELQNVLAARGFDGVAKPKKYFLLTAFNVPRTPINGLMGGEILQRNYVMKALIAAQTNGLLQANVQSISESPSGGERMGLYQPLGAVPYNRTLNVSGIGFSTTSMLLDGLRYDSTQTRLMALPNTIRGAAFKNANGRYTYALWAATNTDQLEYVNPTTYTFPASFGTTRLYRRAWDFSVNPVQRNAETASIPLDDATPVFLSQDSALLRPPVALYMADTLRGCTPLTVRFTDLSQGDSTRLWQFERGTPATSTQRNPTVVFREKGNFNVSLTAQNVAGTHDYTQYEWVRTDSLPTVNFVFTRNNDTALNINFETRVANAFLYLWDFGDGTTLRTNDRIFAHRFARSGTYRVRLAAQNDCGTDSLVQIITIRSPNTSILEQNDALKVVVFPNPTTDNAQIILSSPHETQLTGRLYDATGKMLKIVFQNTLSPNNSHIFPISLENLPNGIYFLQLVSNEGTHATTQKIMIQR